MPSRIARTAMECQFESWNPLPSAGAFSGLAGLLAGFVFTGILLLLPECRPKAGGPPGQVSMKIRTLGLLYAALIVLGIDSYLFGRVAGMGVIDGCRRVLVSYMLASGLLAMGALLLISSVGCLLVIYFEDMMSGGTAADRDTAYLKRLAQWAPILVAVAVVTILAVTADDFLADWYGAGRPGWSRWLLWLYPAITFSATAVLMRVGWPPRRAALHFGAFVSALFAVLAAVAVVSASVVSPATWESPSTAVAVVTVVAAFVLPAPAFVALFNSLEPFNPRRRRRGP